MTAASRFLSTIGLLVCLISKSSLAEKGGVTRSAADTVEELQTWLDNKVSKSDTMVSVSAAVVAAGSNGDDGGYSVHAVVAGHSVLDRAEDEQTGNVVSSPTGEPISATTSSTYMLASVSKIFVWTALSMMLDDGKFDLDDDVNDVLTFNVRNPKHADTAVTYRHLYAHTSGIEDDYDTYLYGDDCPTDDPSNPYPTDLDSSLKVHVAKESNWASFAPGTKYQYSNFATALAALLVEKHSGMPFAEFTEKYIFEPVGMTSTQWTRPTDGSAVDLYGTSCRFSSPLSTLNLLGRKVKNFLSPSCLFNDEYYDYDDDDGGGGGGGCNGQYVTWEGAYCYNDWPSGQLWSTPTDLGRFAWVALQKGNLGDGTCLYGPDTGDLVFEPTSPDTGDGDSALGWFAGEPYYVDGAGHDGSESGVSSDLYVKFAKSKVAAVWLANGELSDGEYSALTKELMATAEKIGTIPDIETPSNCVRTYSDVR